MNVEVPLTDLPLRNRLVATLVKLNVKINPAKKAADAVAEQIGRAHV